MTVKHPTLDLSILVLDAQALPLGNGQCNNCVGYNGKISGSKANAIGMGRGEARRPCTPPAHGLAPGAKPDGPQAAHSYPYIPPC